MNPRNEPGLSPPTGFDPAATIRRSLGPLNAGRSRRPNPLLVHARYLRYVFWEFRWPFSVLASIVLVGGFLLRHSYHKEEVGYARAFYTVFMMVFLESGLDFPDEWYLQPLFFLVPVVGLVAVADSFVRLAYLMFTKKQRLPEWHRMLA